MWSFKLFVISKSDLLPPIQTNLAQLTTCLFFGKNKSNLIGVVWLVCTTNVAVIWAKVNSSKVCLSCLLFYSHQLFGTYRLK